MSDSQQATPEQQERMEAAVAEAQQRAMQRRCNCIILAVL